jgi:hypothetical protein
MFDDHLQQAQQTRRNIKGSFVAARMEGAYDLVSQTPSPRSFDVSIDQSKDFELIAKLPDLVAIDVNHIIAWRY